MDVQTNRIRFMPDYAHPAGETLAAAIDELETTQADIADRTGLSRKHLNQIVKGVAPVTPETALLLERVTGVSAAMWNALEAAYQERRSLEQEAAGLSNDVAWLKELPITELVQRGRISKCRDDIEQLREVLGFFGVANRLAWETIWQKPTAYRKSKAFQSNAGAVAAWLRIGELAAAKIDCQPFDRNRFKSSLRDVRKLTTLEQHRWQPELERICSGAGVAVVIEPEIKGAVINGAVRWLTSDKALIQLSGRHRRADILWFTFFHEAGHLLFHGKREAFIDNEDSGDDLVEAEADTFAVQTLIPVDHEHELDELYTDADIRRFARKIGVHPGIVAGRLQRERRAYTEWRGLLQGLQL